MSITVPLRNTVETFGNWCLDDNGLLYTPRGYLIEAARLGEQRRGSNGVSDWALHIFGKRWCNPEEFIPALRRAIERHASNAGIEWPAWQEAERRLKPAGEHPAFKLIDMDELDKIGELADHLASVGWRPSAQSRRQ